MSIKYGFQRGDYSTTDSPVADQPAQETVTAETVTLPTENGQGITLTLRDFEALLAKVIAAAKAPNEYEAEKIKAEQELKERKRLEIVELGKLEEEMRDQAWATCTHTKPDGRRSVGGQVLSDGLVHLFCLRCNKPFPPFQPPPEMVANGIVGL